MALKINDIEQFNIIDSIGNYLQNNVEDLKKNRKTNRFVYPDFPTSDENLPQIVIELSNIQFNTLGSRNFLHEFRDGLTYKEIYAKEAVATMNLYCISKMNYNAEIEGILLKGKKLNVFMAEQVKDSMYKIRSSLPKSVNWITFQSIDYTFESNATTWASSLQYEINFHDLWCNEYLDGQLIQSYSLTTNIAD